VPGPENGFDWGIVKVKKVSATAAPCYRSINLFFVMSLNGIVSFSFLSCKGFVDSDEFMAIFKKHLDNAIKGVEDKKDK
jgi:hypothetical protein